MLLVVLIGKHATKHVDVAIVGLGGCCSHRQPRSQLLLDELALFEVEKVEVGRVRIQEVQSILARARILSLH